MLKKVNRLTYVRRNQIVVDPDAVYLNREKYRDAQAFQLASRLHGRAAAQALSVEDDPCGFAFVITQDSVMVAIQREL